MNYKKIITSVLLLVSGLWTGTIQAQDFHCPDDTVKAMALVRKYHNPGGDPSKVCADIAAELVGAPYVPVAKQDSLGVAEIRLDGFDEMSFVNTVAAIAKLSTSPGNAWPKDLGMELDKLTFRRGERNGFPSRMLYAGDWILDNKSRDNVKELTEEYSESFKTKSLEYASRHRDEFAALKDSATYDRQKMVELGYRTFKTPHMKRESFGWKGVAEDLKDGDLVVLMSNAPYTDMHEIGFLKKRDDGFHLIHASEKNGKVVEEAEPILRYVKRNAKTIYGWRWLRIR